MIEARSANEYAEHDGILRVRCVGHSTGRHVKSDAFIITLDGNVWLIDGGMRGIFDAYERLLELREAWIGKNSRVTDDESCKLHITCLASHLHVDHVQTAISQIMKSPYIAVDEVYITPETALDTGLPLNDDSYFRSMMKETLKKYQPQARLFVPEYGIKGVMSLRSEGLVLDILPPDSDWGRTEKLNYMYEIYWGGEREGHSIAVQGINANCVWHLLRYAGRSLLFTGDSMKRRSDIHDEPLDRMADIYSDMLGRHIDIVKWPHHGLIRDAAAEFVHSLTPEYILLSAAETETATAVYERLYPVGAARFVRVGREDVTFYVTRDGDISVGYGSDIFTDFASEVESRNEQPVQPDTLK